MSLSVSLISHKSIQWQMTLVSNKESSTMQLSASVYLFPVLTSTHMSLLSVLPAYCSGIAQHIWQAKGKAAVHCLLFLLFKVHIPAKWILSEPKTLAVIPCYKCSLVYLSYMENNKSESLVITWGQNSTQHSYSARSEEFFSVVWTSEVTRSPKHTLSCTSPSSEPWWSSGVFVINKYY